MSNLRSRSRATPLAVTAAGPNGYRIHRSGGDGAPPSNHGMRMLDGGRCSVAAANRPNGSNLIVFPAVRNPASALKLLRNFPRVLSIAALLLFAANPLSACTSCFGKVTGNLANGVNMALLLLLGVTTTVLAGFASFFIYLWRRSRAAEFADPMTRVSTNHIK